MGIYTAGRPPAHQRSERNVRGEAALSGRDASAPLPDSSNELLRGREKIKYAIRQADAGLLYMAGLYRVENGRAVFTILTRKPAEQIRFIHDRMPVILTSSAKQDWLNLDCDAAQTLAQACENVTFCAVNVSC